MRVCVPAAGLLKLDLDVVTSAVTELGTMQGEDGEKLDVLTSAVETVQEEVSELAVDVSGLEMSAQTGV